MDAFGVSCRKKSFGKLTSGSINVYLGTPFHSWRYNALEAVDTLRVSGYRAVRLEESVQDWRAQGFPLETVKEDI